MLIFLGPCLDALPTVIGLALAAAHHVLDYGGADWALKLSCKFRGISCYLVEGQSLRIICS